MIELESFQFFLKFRFLICLWKVKEVLCCQKLKNRALSAIIDFNWNNKIDSSNSFIFLTIGAFWEKNIRRFIVQIWSTQLLKLFLFGACLFFEIFRYGIKNIMNWTQIEFSQQRRFNFGKIFERNSCNSFFVLSKKHFQLKNS